MTNTSVVIRCGTGMDDKDFEVVERKGIGHPDTVADGISMACSVALMNRYLLEYGTMKHFNVDKVLISAGKSTATFGHGKILSPIKVFISGRASPCEGLHRLLEHTTKKYIDSLFPLIPKKGLKVKSLVQEGSRDLVYGCFDRKGEFPKANDTSIGVGYAPFSSLEKAVQQIEGIIHNRTSSGMVGNDVKIMGIRTGNNIDLIISVAMIAKNIKNRGIYDQVKKDITKMIECHLPRLVDFPFQIREVRINAADTDDSPYLTVIGGSMENGDDGMTGRGNKINGLITPCRTMTMEAAAGKNPINHVGVLYNLVAKDCAFEIYERFKDEIKEAKVILVSKIGQSINDPSAIKVGIKTNGNLFNHYKGDILQIIYDRLQRINEYKDRIMEGHINRLF